MKKLVISLVFFAFALSINAQSNVIKTNPLGLAFGNFNVTYERVISSSSSILLEGQYMYKLLGIKVNLGGLGVGYRYYITHVKKPVPSGFYINPQASFSFGSVTDNADVMVSANTFGIGAELGYQWAWESGFVLDLGIGPMYNFTSASSGSDVASVNGFSPTATLAVGYAF